MSGSVSVANCSVIQPLGLRQLEEMPFASWGNVWSFRLQNVLSLGLASLSSGAL